MISVYLLNESTAWEFDHIFKERIYYEKENINSGGNRNEHSGCGVRG